MKSALRILLLILAISTAAGSTVIFHWSDGAGNPIPNTKFTISPVLAANASVASAIMSYTLDGAGYATVPNMQAGEFTARLLTSPNTYKTFVVPNDTATYDWTNLVTNIVSIPGTSISVTVIPVPSTTNGLQSFVSGLNLYLTNFIAPLGGGGGGVSVAAGTNTVASTNVVGTNVVVQINVPVTAFQAPSATLSNVASQIPTAVNLGQGTNLPATNLVGSLPLYPSPVPFVLGAVGDSLSSGYMVNGQSWFYYVTNIFIPNAARTTNAAYNGAYAYSWAFGNYTSLMHPNRPGVGTNGFLGMFTGINDLSSLATTGHAQDPYDIFLSISNVAAEAHADGWRTIGSTITLDQSIPATNESSRNALNAYIRQATNLFDYFVDIDRMFPQIVTSSNNYSAGDNKHWGTNMQYAIAREIYRQLCLPPNSWSCVNPDNELSGSVMRLRGTSLISSRGLRMAQMTTNLPGGGWGYEATDGSSEGYFQFTNGVINIYSYPGGGTFVDGVYQAQIAVDGLRIVGSGFFTDGVAASGGPSFFSGGNVSIFPGDSTRHIDLGTNGTARVNGLIVTNAATNLSVVSAIYAGDGNGKQIPVAIGSGMSYTGNTLSATASGGSVTQLNPDAASVIQSVANATTTPTPTFAPSIVKLGTNNGGSLTNLTASKLVGTIPSATLPSGVITNNYASTANFTGASFGGFPVGDPYSLYVGPEVNTILPTEATIWQREFDLDWVIGDADGAGSLWFTSFPIGGGGSINFTNIQINLLDGFVMVDEGAGGGFATLMDSHGIMLAGGTIQSNRVYSAMAPNLAPTAGTNIVVIGTKISVSSGVLTNNETQPILLKNTLTASNQGTWNAGTIVAKDTNSSVTLAGGVLNLVNSGKTYGFAGDIESAVGIDPANGDTYVLGNNSNADATSLRIDWNIGNIWLSAPAQDGASVIISNKTSATQGGLKVYGPLTFSGAGTGNGSGFTNLPLIVSNYYFASGTAGQTKLTNTLGQPYFSNCVVQAIVFVPVTIASNAANVVKISGPLFSYVNGVRFQTNKVFIPQSVSNSPWVLITNLDAGDVFELEEYCVTPTNQMFFVTNNQENTLSGYATTVTNGYSRTNGLTHWSVSATTHDGSTFTNYVITELY